MADTVFEIAQWIDAPADIVFDFFVDPAKIVLWMGQEARSVPRAGGDWRILFPGGVETWGRYLSIDRPRSLVFSWGSRNLDGSLVPNGPGLTTRGDSVVEVTFSEKNERTLVTLKHSGFAVGEPVAAGWTPFLAVLADVATS